MKLNQKKPLRILVLGGCHTMGYPFGPESGFPVLFSNNLGDEGISHQLFVKPYITLNKKHLLVEALEECNPDLIILQCGHHEFRQESLFKKMKKKKNFNLESPTGIPISQRFNPGRSFYLKQDLKHIFNWIFGYSFLRKNLWRNHIASFFQEIERYGPEKCVVLGTFPTSNRVTNNYRKKGEQLIRKEAANFSFDFVGGFHEKIPASFGPVFTVDEGHLIPEAHHIIAQSISLALQDKKGLIRKIFTEKVKITA